MQDNLKKYCILLTLTLMENFRGSFERFHLILQILEGLVGKEEKIN